MRSLVAVAAALTVLSCGDDHPTAPTPTPQEPIEGVFYWFSGGVSLDEAYLCFQGQPPYGFRLENPGCVSQVGDTVAIREEGHYWNRDSVLVLDVTSQSPVDSVSALYYTFVIGRNEFTYRLQSGRLELLAGDWNTVWKEPCAPFDGRYWFQSSQEAALNSFWHDAELELNPDLSFALTNPVWEADDTIEVVEAGAYKRAEAIITFIVDARYPDDAFDLHTFPEETTEVWYAESGGSLLLTLEHAGMSDTTVWRLTIPVREEEPNDDPPICQTLPGPGYYEVDGNLSSGGVDAQGYYIGDLDYFGVIPSRTGSLSATLSWAADADMDMYLFDADLNLLNNDGATWEHNPESFTHPVSGGASYYLLVASYDNPGDYRLSVDVP